MSERKFAVIGHPIGHTMSPFIHRRLFELSGMSGSYDILDISPEQLTEKYSELRTLNGYNVTIPHKPAIIPFLDKLDKKARLYGSVNTVKNGEISEGFTTDPDGFLMALKTAGIPLGKSVVILGSGGVARTFAYEAALAGCNTTIAVRPEDLPAAAALAGEIKVDVYKAYISTSLISRLNGDFDLLINATPLGMYPNTDVMAATPQLLARCANVFDAVYNPLETKLLKAARANGSKAVGGMSMLVWQAVRSHEIWDNVTYRDEDIAQLVEDSAREVAKRF